MFQHTGTTYKNVTIEAGVSAKGYGLGVSAADYNNDGWVDLYVSNDYNSPDFLYINQKNGTFKNTLEKSMGHTSFFSMGTDAADINNDGLLDVAVLDMVAEDNYRLKANMGGMNPESFWATVKEGGHYQYMFNTLQLNRGVDAKGTVHFSDVAQMAGTAHSDWSWSPLFADFDNDGDKDLYCTNGLVRDLRNTDAIKNIQVYYKAAAMKFQSENPDAKNVSLWDIIDYKVALSLFPSQPLSNYFFQNNGNIQFDNQAKNAGLNQKGFSTGAAYGDLDNDGDLDLVVNNLNDDAWLFQNQNSGNYLRVQVKEGNKISLFGTKIIAQFGDDLSLSNKQIIELTSARGFYSSSENIAHFGLGDITKVAQLTIEWQDGTVSILNDIEANQMLIVDKFEVGTMIIEEPVRKLVNALLHSQYNFSNKTIEIGLNLKHQENTYDDFDKEVLLPHKMSQFGPALAVGDVNGDGKEDFYLGGAKDFAAALMLQTENSKFKKATIPAFESDKIHEDINATFFDADMDGDLDLYVVSGGNEAIVNDATYQDRLYLNDKGNWTKASLSKHTESGSVVRPYDYDGDGDLDLFVGGRQVPASYPSPASSVILKNNLKENGSLSFENVTTTIAAELEKVGMVTDAIWTDYDGDKDIDLLLTGEWMPITFFENTNGTFKKVIPLEKTEGWWFSAEAIDMDGDGDEDYLLGNLGLNSKYKATEKEPFSVHYDDFDENGSYDIVLSYYNFGTKYPVRGRSCSSEQVPVLADKFPTYDGFAQADLFDVYGKDKLQKALNLDVHNFKSSWLENKGKGEFTLHELPRMAQVAPINDWLVLEKEGKRQIVSAGNLYNTEVETTRADGGKGLVLSVDKEGKLKVIPPTNSRLYLPKEVRQLAKITINGEPMILVATNNDKVEIWGY